jgi:NAD(P)-dependent dehydrogenase (short-subunit alcohol dehydrogenase family)
LLSPAFISVAISKKMSCEGGGVIINISGGGATSPRPNFSCYSTTKAALVRFSETLAEELKDDNVRVNCISPGPMATPLLGEIINIGEERSGSKEFYDAKKIFQSQKLDMGKVTDLVLFLLSNASKGINGKIISAVWDNWREWPLDLEGLSNSDVFTLRRVIGKDRGMNWCDNE